MEFSVENTHLSATLSDRSLMQDFNYCLNVNKSRVLEGSVEGESRNMTTSMKF